MLWCMTRAPIKNESGEILGKSKAKQWRSASFELTPQVQYDPNNLRQGWWWWWSTSSRLKKLTDWLTLPESAYDLDGWHWYKSFHGSIIHSLLACYAIGEPVDWSIVLRVFFWFCCKHVCMHALLCFSHSSSSPPTWLELSMIARKKLQCWN